MNLSGIILTIILILVGLWFAPLMTIGVLFITSNISPELGIILILVGFIRMIYRLPNIF